MQKSEAIATLAKHRGEALSVTTMQAAYPWHAAGQTARLHIEAVACMGSASTIGLGLALGAPGRSVMVLDGDGSLLMQLGSLVTIGSAAPANFFHFVFSNGYYESSGNQPVPGAGTCDFVTIAKAAGYRDAVRFESASELDQGLPALFAREGPILIDLVIARDDATPRWVGRSMAEMVQALRRDLGTEPAAGVAT
jgi:sulfopyruvate decarboxylase subunit beta